MTIFGDRFRYVIAALIFCSTLSIYVGRINLSTAIVEMAAPTQKSSTHNVYAHRGSAPKFDWNEKTQGLILGSFFWGYFLFLVPGGRLAETFGPRLLTSAGILVTGVLNLVTPLVAPNLYALIGSRVLLGAFQALVFPSCFALATKWIPDHERSTVISLTAIGGAVGTMIASSISGYLCKHGFAGGWPSAFYVSGVICITIAVLFFVTIKNDPADHSFVTDTERLYITENISATKLNNQISSENGENDQNADPHKNRNSSDHQESFPWRRVLTSRFVIAEICVKIAMTWTYSLVILKAPAYMEHVLRMPLEQSGYFTSAIFASFGLSHLAGGIAADYAIRKLRFTKTTIRKTFETIATFGTSAFLALVPLIGDRNRIAFLFAMIGSQATFGMQAGGELPLPSDMSNKYAATIFAIGNMCGMSTAFVGPYVAGAVLDAERFGSLFVRWSYVIYFTAIFNCVGGAIFVVFASAKPRPDWERANKPIEQAEANATQVRKD